VTVFSFWGLLFISFFDWFIFTSCSYGPNGWPSAASISFVVALHLLSKNVQSHPFYRCCYCWPTIFQQVAMYRAIILSIVIAVSQQAAMSGIPILSNLLIFFSIHSNFFFSGLV
jgi:hypothetical protein